MTKTGLMAIGSAALLSTGAAYQAALALGAPLGEATLGGRAGHEDGVLEPTFRVIAAVSGALLLLFAWIVLRRAHLVPLPGLSERVIRVATWNIAVLLAFNTLGNLAAPHPLERWGMGGITLAAGLLAAGVAWLADREGTTRVGTAEA